MIEFQYIISGALAGMVIGLTGVGGGALMTPILLIFFDVLPVTAVATDLWFAAITKIIAARIHYSNGNVDWKVAKRLWIGSLPVAVLIVITVTSGVEISKSELMTQAIGFVLLITSLGMIFGQNLTGYARSYRVANAVHFKSLQPTLTVAAGAMLGMCVAVTSIGAGALGSVLMLYLYPLRMTPHRIVATDIVHAIPLAVVSGIGYLIAGMVSWLMLLFLLIGSVPAVIIGSHFAARIQGRSIMIALGFVLALAGLKVML